MSLDPVRADSLAAAAPLELPDDLVAPQPSYRSAYLPRIWDAIDRGDRNAIPGYEREIVVAFDRASSILRDATALLADGG